MPRTPHILITNDDGIHAAGLRALVEAVKDLGTVSIVAPSQERSGAAQSLTLRQPIFCEQVAEREWSIEGHADRRHDRGPAPALPARSGLTW